jgi:serine/threonine protein kinase
MAKIFGGSADAKTIKEAFEPEAKAFENMNHPNCVKCHKIFGDGKNGDVMILELIDGMDFRGAVFEKKMFAQGIPKPLLLDILIQMTEAIRHCHCDLFMVHRDLHVGNWMITY